MKAVTSSICALMIMAMASTASAQQAITGTVTGIDEPSGTISIQQTSSGTVGATGAVPTESYKVKDGLLFNAVHLGDKVSVAIETLDNAKTITRLDKQ
jgi:Cu/Ag efflux protein CusF